uniref:Uncharacterized protein n=1 Tax=Rhizophagus irregularis (strain DAOM 181602 / DAOM 197198 / MUCL 43194) TaxID=747089 RepID=U9TM61_RHIID
MISNDLRKEKFIQREKVNNKFQSLEILDVILFFLYNSKKKPLLRSNFQSLKHFLDREF